MAVGRPIQRTAKNRVDEVLTWLATSSFDGCTYSWPEVSFGTEIAITWIESVRSGRITDPPLSKLLALAEFFHVPVGALALALATDTLSLRETLVPSVTVAEVERRHGELRHAMWLAERGSQDQYVLERKRLKSEERAARLAERRKKYNIED